MSPQRRARPTRWLLVTPLVALALIVAGTWWLESLHPQLETADNAVAGVPPAAIDSERTCTRQADEEHITEVQTTFPAHGRVTSTQVVACPAAFDGLQVTFVGEVVGELLPRRGGAWAQVNDDAYALEVGPVVGHREHAGFNTGLAVWLPDGLHEQVERPGRPAVRGDVVLVRGTLHRADADDGGGLTVRGEELERLAAPLEVEPPLHVVQLVVAVALSVLALASVVWARVRRRR